MNPLLIIAIVAGLIWTWFEEPRAELIPVIIDEER